MKGERFVYINQNSCNKCVLSIVDTKSIISGRPIWGSVLSLMHPMSDKETVELVPCFTTVKRSSSSVRNAECPQIELAIGNVSTEALYNKGSSQQADQVGWCSDKALLNLYSGAARFESRPGGRLS
jgi:hypothetical protein